MTEAEQLANARVAVMSEYLLRLIAWRKRKRTPRNASETGQRVCECGCGKRFKPYRANQRFASPECRRKAWQKSREGSHID
ncbi:hypothetical protein LCGC14_1670270 [marine sediment metagenome]|uniref:Uncharacterized protein n=1 Tax=marine sediment metagenome TaxID=412755 RepID=A0A0F9IE50_9ZZZZ